MLMRSAATAVGNALAKRVQWYIAIHSSQLRFRAAPAPCIWPPSPDAQM